MSQCVGPNEEAFGVSWHVRNTTQCPACQQVFCLSCAHGCPACGLGRDVDRRETVRQPFQADVEVRRVG